VSFSTRHRSLQQRPLLHNSACWFHGGEQRAIGPQLLKASLLVLLAPRPRVYERLNDSWEVCVSLSDGQFQQVSFVNSINTIKGGTHVQQVTDQVAKFLLAKAQKKLGKAGSNPEAPSESRATSGSSSTPSSSTLRLTPRPRRPSTRGPGTSARRASCPRSS